MKLFLLTIEKQISFLYYKSNAPDCKAVSGTKRQCYCSKVWKVIILHMYLLTQGFWVFLGNIRLGAVTWTVTLFPFQYFFNRGATHATTLTRKTNSWFWVDKRVAHKRHCPNWWYQKTRVYLRTQNGAGNWSYILKSDPNSPFRYSAKSKIRFWGCTTAEEILVLPDLYWNTKQNIAFKNLDWSLPSNELCQSEFLAKQYLQ